MFHFFEEFKIESRQNWPYQASPIPGLPETCEEFPKNWPNMVVRLPSFDSRNITLKSRTNEDTNTLFIAVSDDN
jgi:hypothetical protein